MKLRIVQGNDNNPNVFIIQYLEHTSDDGYEWWHVVPTDLLNTYVGSIDCDPVYSYKEYKSLEDAEKAIEEYQESLKSIPRVKQTVIKEYTVC